MDYRNYLLKALHDGKITDKIFHNRIVLACRRYREESESREYYRTHPEEVAARVRTWAAATGQAAGAGE